MSLPSRQEAEKELELGGQLNPGQWIDHSRNVARACEIIAAAAGIDAGKAYVLGLLHDIGRRIGRCGQKHIYAGYTYCLKKGWDEAAKISLTHSYLFNDAEIGGSEYDGPAEEWDFVKEYMRKVQFDDYDRLVQLGDAIGDATGFCFIEKRLVDVALRYGVLPRMLEKWQKLFEIKAYFDNKCGQSVYNLLPGIRDNI